MYSLIKKVIVFYLITVLFENRYNDDRWQCCRVIVTARQCAMRVVVTDKRDSDCSKMVVHDDVIKWKYFPRYWPFVR